MIQDQTEKKNKTQEKKNNQETKTEGQQPCEAVLSENKTLPPVRA